MSALCDAIHMGRSVLVETVEMERSWPILELVVNIDDDLIADIGFNSWDRPLAVDAHDSTLKLAIRISRQPADIKVVGTSLGRAEGT